MKKFFLSVFAAVLSLTLFAQNESADNIIGTYSCGTGKDAYKVKITKLSDGTYKGAVCWVANPLDKDGKPALDSKNPDKNIRNTPIDKVVLFSGLQYDAKKQNWGGTKIYDPNRGIRVKVTIAFDNPKILKVRGTVLGIGETAVWVRE